MQKNRLKTLLRIVFSIALTGLALGLLALALDTPSVANAQNGGGSPTHPTFALLDKDGQNVIDSGNPISTMQTCGQCHDTNFIALHSFHTDIGFSDLSAAGLSDYGHDWDTSPGYFGRWNAITYRYLSPEGDEIVDLTTAEWIQEFGGRHVGGGPAIYSQNGGTLSALEADDTSLENMIVDENGELQQWDWQASGVVEMNCFLCHIEASNNETRLAALNAGDFQWANSATLIGTGIIESSDDGYIWNSDAFNSDGELLDEYVGIQDPISENCGQCHGEVHNNDRIPLEFDACSMDNWETLTTGEVVSSQQISQSALNIEDKAGLTRTWDVHAERVVECTGCHFSLNNPVYYFESDDSQPDHLVFDPRRLDFGDYLFRPSHQFAKGESAQSNLAPDIDNTIRTCESCHADSIHDWLPYQDRHIEVLACQTCHVPEMYAPALSSVDWTVINTDSTPQEDCRGMVDTNNTLPYITGYEPVLLPVEEADGNVRLSPHNLVTAWYWVYGDPARPVPLRYLEDAYLEDGEYQSAVVAAFDSDGDGTLSDTELIIDTDAKEQLIRDNLMALGLENPQIVGDIQPYSISHNVTHGEWATRDCSTCHASDSRLNQTFLLANNIPQDVMPSFVDSPSIDFNGDLYIEDDKLYYQPKSQESDLYILGHDNQSLVDIFGMLAFVGTLLGVAGHSTLRYFAARSRPEHHIKHESKYMYTIYERQWHWLQTLLILGLIFTGLVIHKPDSFSMFSFRYMVVIHNVMAAILVINAALAAFYHLVSGEIQQFLPQPKGFFNQAFEQAMFYLRGIFRGDGHPFEKTLDRKLNPIQQATYFAILNVLLPLQVITGALMWGAQQFPDAADAVGGLPLLAPFHSLTAWMFVSFIIVHVYMTTTGHTPLAGIKAMVTGWDEVEVHADHTDHATSTSAEETNA